MHHGRIKVLFKTFVASIIEPFSLEEKQILFRCGINIAALHGYKNPQSEQAREDAAYRLSILHLLGDL